MRTFGVIFPPSLPRKSYDTRVYSSWPSNLSSRFSRSRPSLVSGPMSPTSKLLPPRRPPGTSFSADSRGPFAAYALKPGEALYSSVIVRFTGRTLAEDVRTIAEALRRRSDIVDLHDIPVGFEVKIPLDMLEPQFLPAGHPRRREAEAARVELERELQREPVAGTRGGLDGVLVVLDPGHGGRDLGTINNGIWEHATS